MLFHITTESLWEEAQRQGEVAIPDPAEGFIHCSWRNQVLRVAAALFAGRASLVLLRIDAAAVAGDLVEEDLYQAGEPFPHVYAAIPVAAVLSAHRFEADERGVFYLPAGI